MLVLFFKKYFFVKNHRKIVDVVEMTSMLQSFHCYKSS